MNKIDWTDPDCRITDNFTVSDACTLHAWNRLASEIDGLDDKVKANLLIVFGKLEELRKVIGHPINVHCGFRSADYNATQLKLEKAIDVHTLGQAVDFDCHPHLTIIDTKVYIRSKLEELNIRMEANTPTWVHIDIHAVGPSGREFHA